MKRSRIAGVGAYVPDRVITNQDLTQWMDTSDDWIVQRSGIKERHWVQPGTSNSDLAKEAALLALTNAKTDKKDIDLIILATLSPDHDFPGTACFLQAKLGLSEIPTLDIRQQCTGFVYGLSIADQFIRTGMYKKILLVGSEVHSIGLDISTRGRDVSVLFGDGAGAVVIEAVDVNNPETDSYIYSTHLHADGSQAKELWTPAPGNGLGGPDRINAAIMAEGLHFPAMNGKKVFMSAIKRMCEALDEGLKANSMSLDQIDLFLFHQANLRINEAVVDTLKIPREKVFNTIHKYGNTTAATLPLGMRDAIQEGVLKPGMRVAMAAFGSGYTWGSSILRF